MNRIYKMHPVHLANPVNPVQNQSTTFKGPGRESQINHKEVAMKTT